MLFNLCIAVDRNLFPNKMLLLWEYTLSDCDNVFAKTPFEFINNRLKKMSWLQPWGRVNSWQIKIPAKSVSLGTMKV